MLDRRLFLRVGIAGAFALTFSSVWSQSAPNFGLPDLPSVGHKRMKLGSMETIALNDGAMRRPLGEEVVTIAPLECLPCLHARQIGRWFPLAIPSVWHHGAKWQWASVQAGGSLIGIVSKRGSWAKYNQSPRAYSSVG